MKYAGALLMLGCLVSAGAMAAGHDAAPAKPRPGAMVEWVLPAAASTTPQSDAEKEAGRVSGRTLPTPELLQPTLDPALPRYQAGKIRLHGKFTGASSDVLVELVKKWIAAFRKYQPGVDLSIEPPYAGSLGTKELIKESVDFVFVSRELKPEDISEFSARFGYGPTSIPISGGSYRHYGFLDALGFFVHPDNPLQKLDFDQIDAIFSSTHHRGGKPITTWGQLGLTGEWADKPIHVNAIKPWNGFEEFVRQRVLDHDGKRGEWRDDLRYEAVVFPLAGNVADDRYALGYSGLAYLDAPVKVLALRDGKQGDYVSPTYENVAAARYPLSRLVFFNVNKKPGKALDPAMDEFLRFILSREGQQVVVDQGVFLPLRANQADDSRASLQKK
jgi:phosphate transport system substrate-binding protein